ncbi:amino acid/amide ABC transporter substrate-binding protein (HAAT family) [Ancylobacter aquaticus]|uniref:Amino acid/amide ABC transporter substrate-binding protein (HAAT family) n=1 Tax=Ancylobacter aquaticus TaxID=100 RepID=A0A4R1HHU2_ANCAQ|nr:transporter substrate-binding domain-containing protein [Ancylobacter aquaticus]TCK16772.1 amino acid/amide ABC transporter substrate-binding protein (HAAT family) [Ancylobacter aquaticus]
MTAGARGNDPTNDVWRVGLLFSATGVTAGVETSQLGGTLLAIDEINAAGGVRGRRIEAVVYDPASDPRAFRRLAQTLLAEDGVRLLFGCYMSSTRKAVLPVVEAHDGLLFYPTLYEGFEYSSHCVYTGAAPNQNSIQLATYLLRHYGNRFFLIGSDYVYPHESNRIMSDFVVQSRGQVCGEVYVPLGAPARAFAEVMEKVREAGPDVIFSTVVGADTARLYEAHHAAGFDSRRLPIASLTTSEAEVALMPREVAAGHITAAPFFETLGTPAARRFVAAFKKRNGVHRPVTAAAEAAYFQLHLAMQALERAGTDAPEALLAELGACTFEAPQGRVRIEPSNHHAWLRPRIAEIGADGRFHIVWDAGASVKPDPYCVVQNLDDWPADGRQFALS